MLGFHPVNSAVVLALDGPRVKFCARADLEWFDAGFDTILGQILRCADNVGASRFVVLGYGAADAACVVVSELVAAIGVERVVDALVTTGRTSWAVLDDSEQLPYRFDASSVAAQAVYHGVNIERGRDAATAPVERCSPAAGHVVAAAERAAGAMSASDAMSRLAVLLEGGELAPPDALLLAVLLKDEDRLAEVLARMKTWTADRYWLRLVEARAVCPRQCEPNVLALLAVASWLSGKGAAHASCLEQLTALAPRHLVLGLLLRIHEGGIPPSRWDE